MNTLSALTNKATYSSGELCIYVRIRVFLVGGDTGYVYSLDDRLPTKIGKFTVRRGAHTLLHPVEFNNDQAKSGLVMPH